MATTELSAKIYEALHAALPKSGDYPIRRVRVDPGWGSVHFVTVFCGIRRVDADIHLEAAIHRIVGDELDPRRYTVRIVWAESC